MNYNWSAAGLNFVIASFNFMIGGYNMYFALVSLLVCLFSVGQAIKQDGVRALEAHKTD